LKNWHFRHDQTDYWTFNDNPMQLQIKSADTLEEITALRTLFEDYLRCVYWSELALSPVFSDMINHISSKDMVRILTQHAVNTRIHADRI
jgi:hypothetical protein